MTVPRKSSGDSTQRRPALPPSGLPSRLAPLWFRIANRRRIATLRPQLAGLPLIGGMASIPSRAANLPKVLDSVLPQVDRLHLFLHGYDAIPPGIERDRLIVHLAPRSHPFRASGKFYGLQQEPAPCLYFGFDDDIDYLPGHVQRLRAALLRYGGLALVGLHTTSHGPRHIRYRRAMRVSHFAKRRLVDTLADEVGVGTAAFYSELMRIDPPSWPYGDMDDIMLAIEGARRGLPRISIARPPNAILALSEDQPDSLYHAMMIDDTRQTAQLMRLREITASQR